MNDRSQKLIDSILNGRSSADVVEQQLTFDFSTQDYGEIIDEFLGEGYVLTDQTIQSVVIRLSSSSAEYVGLFKRPSGVVLYMQDALGKSTNHYYVDYFNQLKYSLERLFVRGDSAEAVDTILKSTLKSR